MYILHKTTKELSQIQIYTFLAYAFPWLIFVKKKKNTSFTSPSIRPLIYVCVRDDDYCARPNQPSLCLIYERCDDDDATFTIILCARCFIKAIKLNINTAYVFFLFCQYIYFEISLAHVCVYSFCVCARVTSSFTPK